MCDVSQHHGQGGKSDGELTSVGETSDYDWLKQFTRAFQSPTPRCGQFNGSDAELDVIVTYMALLK
jgi:hypothetical protein